MAQIAREQCVELRTAPGFYLEAYAARQFDAACDAFGRRIILTGAWRSYERQVELFDSELHPDTGRYVRGDHRGKRGFTNDLRGPYRGSFWTRKADTAAAAVPGESNHGAGRAFDAKTRRDPDDPPATEAVVFTGWDDPDREAFLEVARPYGWAATEGVRVGEHWHITFYEELVTRRAPTTTGGLIMATISDRDARAIVDALVGDGSALKEVLDRLRHLDGDGMGALERLDDRTEKLTDLLPGRAGEYSDKPGFKVIREARNAARAAEARSAAVVAAFKAAGDGVVDVALIEKAAAAGARAALAELGDALDGKG
jgi:hypothetical protein